AEQLVGLVSSLSSTALLQRGTLSSHETESAACPGQLPAVSSGRKTAHPVLQMWRIVQRRGAASAEQLLPLKVFHMQG
ncbi:hypothetical protein GOODEAATRI_017810, partial [Goodea atripinnis]